ncbi:MAG: 3-methyl-2-oxobutanoate hydroxymethyltransferase [bacterium]|jgi:3-methyl-2-oxobutanoate hydroxymethyltransferase
MRIAIKKIQAMKNETPIIMATAYDAWMARMVDPDVDCILIGDSLGMVVQGFDSTIPVTLDEIIYHTKMVARGSQNAFLIADLPFLTYQTSVEDAVLSAGRCLKEGMAQAVKLEGGKPVLPQIQAISSYGIPVVAHLGLTPQSIHAFGGFGKQGKTDSAANELIENAQAVEKAGACMLVVENIPHDLAKKVCSAVQIPVIGIGAGADCDGQVQVFHDLFGLDPDFSPRHAVPFMDGGKQIREAVQQYAKAVRSGELVSK